MTPTPPTDPEAADDPFAQRLRQAVAMPDAPPALVHAAIHLWAARSGPAVALEAVVRRLRAVLSFDSATAASGVLATRSGSGAGGPRHLLFSVDGRDIDLRVQADAGSFTLAGQVLGPDEAGRIDLLAGDVDIPVASADLNSLGEFRITDVAAGRYELLLCLGDDEITLPAIDVGASRT